MELRGATEEFAVSASTAIPSGLRRRDRSQYQDGAAERSLPARRAPDWPCAQGHWKTITFVAAPRRNGMKALCTVDGSMNGAKFLAYVEQCLAPTPKRKDIVVIDHLPAHKAAGIHERLDHCPQYAEIATPESGQYFRACERISEITIGPKCIEV